MAEIAGSEFVQELFAQRAWLGRLAFSLVRDEAEAVDLVQDAWVAALRTQPARDGGLRSWLATVVRNRARTQAREKRNRKRREMWASRGERLISTGEVVECASVQKEVADCVMRLPEPYRETILLCFFEDLPPREIAKRMDVPVATVKVRLGRGLERLRVLLDQTHGGDRSVWMSSVAVLFIMPSPSGWLKWAGAAVAVAACGVAVRVALEPPVVVGEEETSSVAPPSLLPGSSRVLIEVPPIVEFEESNDTQLPGGKTSETLGALAVNDPSAKALTESNTTPSEHASPRTYDRGVPGFPGDLISIRGQRAYIGLSNQNAAELSTRFESASAAEINQFLPQFSVPQHKLKVPAFKLMRTEVTNEQYMMFVRHGRGQAPIQWAATSLPSSINGFWQGEPGYGQLARRWWCDQGLDAPWEMPPETAALPVVGVDVKDVEAYAAWLGLRLPTEFEYEAAVRKKRGGFSWNKRRPAEGVFMARDTNGPLAAGRSVGDKSANGVLHLHGNVSEWTAPVLTIYPKWNPESLGITDSDLERMRTGFERLRVVRGGSYSIPRDLGCAGLRQAHVPEHTRPDLGFRCAASLAPGVDRANWIVEQGLGDTFQTYAEHLRVDRTMAIDRWIESRVVGGALDAAPVLKGYEVVLFTPFEHALPSTTDNAGNSVDGLHALGLLHTTIDLGSGAPRAETYLVFVLADDSAVGSVIFVPVNALDSRDFVAGFTATLESEPGPRSMSLREDHGSGTRELALRASIPTQAGGWWTIDWNFQVRRAALKGSWRDRPWSEKSTR